MENQIRSDLIQNDNVQKRKFKIILPPKKITILVAIIFTFILITIIFLVYQKKQSGSKTTNTSSIPVEQPKLINNLYDPEIGIDTNIPKTWKEYQNNALGISFKYPPEWGDVQIIPYQNLTHLKEIKDQLNKDYPQGDQVLNINFSSSTTFVSLDFIYDEYLGNKYPNSEIDDLGYIDNFSQLQKSGNICDYHFSFGPSKDFSGSLSEIYNTCVDGIKTVVTADNILASQNYTFKSEQFFFKKLNNGYFDNLLVRYHIESDQSLNNIADQDKLFPQNKLEDMSLFKKFVSTIKSFTPTAINTITPSTNSNDSQNVKIIKQYYSLLANQKLTEAFAMHQNPKFSFQDFTGWYNQVFGANIYNIKQVSSNTYRFDVDLSEKNQPISKYRITTEVNNNKINNLSSEQILSDEVKFGDYLAYSRLKSNKNEMVLIKNGEEKIIDDGDNDWENKIGTTTYFSNPSFSPSGKYLIYDASGWEWGSPILYDIAKQQQISIDLSYADIFFSQDEKYLLSCTSAGIGSGVSAIIYSAPDFSVKKDFKSVIENLTFESVVKNNNSDTDFSSFPVDARCSYSPEKSEYIIVISNSDNQQKTIKYNLNTNQVTIK
jgi:hypothetical protein